MQVAAEREHATALLVVPRACPAGRSFALSSGATLHHSEHFLVLGPTPPADPLLAEVAVREARPEDGDAARRVRAAAFGEQWAEVGEESDPSERHLVVEWRGSVVGALRLSTLGATTGIYGFAILPAYQGRGIGRDVLRRVCKQARRDARQEVTLEVAVDNERALGLYTSVGFEPRTTEDYWSLPTGR